MIMSLEDFGEALAIAMIFVGTYRLLEMVL